MPATPTLPSIADARAALGPGRPLHKRIWVPLIVSVIAGLLVHAPVYLGGLVNPDSLWHGEYSLAGVWELSIGRWGLYFVDLLHAGINATTLIAFFTIVYTAAAGTLLSLLFQVRSMTKAVLIPTLLTTSPMVSMFITYPYCGDAYALSILLGVLAVYAVSALSSKWLKMAAGSLCVTLLLGLYQSSLGVMLAVSAGWVLMRLLRHPDAIKATGRDALWLCVSAVLGALLYYAVLQLILRINGGALADYKGASGLSIGAMLQNIPGGIRSAYLHFRAFFLQGWIASNPYFTPFIYCALAAAALAALVLRLVAISPRRPYLPVLCAALLAVFPVCCNIINLIVPNTDIYLLMAAGMMMTAPLLIALTDAARDENGQGGADGGKKKAPAWAEKALAAGSAALAVALVWVYVLSCQTDAAVMQISKNQTVTLANRIWQQVEAREDYVPGETPLLMAGHPQQGNYPNPSSLFDRANGHAKWGMVWNTYEGNIHTWAQAYRLYLGVTYRLSTPEQFAAISASHAFKRMPLYPQAGSMQMLDGVLVVKLSPTDEWAG